jgi:hypothetical protein
VSSTATTQTWNIYLQETLTGGASSYITAQNGLLGAGFSVKNTTGQTTSAYATITAATDQTGNGGNFAGGTSTMTSIGAGVHSYSDLQSVSISASSGPSTNGGEILLATLTFTLSSTQSTFTLNERNGSNGNTKTFMDQVSLDTTQTGSNKAGDGNTIPAFTGASGDPFTITIPAAAVPEPSSMVLCGLAACGGAIGAYRRRRAKSRQSALPIQPDSKDV